EDEISPSIAKTVLSSENRNNKQTQSEQSFPPKLTRKSDKQFNFVSDNVKNRVFRSIKNIKQEFFSNGQPINITEISSSNTNSITTSSDFLYLDEQFKINRIKEFPDYQGNINKVAYRVSSEQGTANMGCSAVLNPFEFLDHDRWTLTFDYYIPVLQGKGGKENQQYVQKNNMLFQTEDENGQKWFRYQIVIPKSSEGHREECNIFWNQQSNFLPVCSIQIRDKQTYSSIQVQWKKMDNFFIPLISSNVYFMSDGHLSVRQKMTMQEMQFNKPIDSKQFSYSALGLSDGDILVDQIKQQIFTIQNDKPVYLAKFYEKYQTPHEQSFNWVRIFILLLSFALIVVGIYLKVRRKRIE
ncbi:MAG: hypothetical protein LBP87_03175, partial [Planctomycetaceae bacterium]|nr:hypothetical protein [Planctomycetaceae bacterium]